MRPQPKTPRREGGFSLIELMIAMAVTLVIAGLASSLLASALNSKTRDDRRSDAIADARRALNIMSREIANAGAALPDGLRYTPAAGAATAVPSNGIILTDSGADTLRFVANLNGAPPTNDTDVADLGEDVKYSLYIDPANDRSLLVRRDADGDSSVLSNRIDDLDISYTDRNPTTGVMTTGLASPSANTVALDITVSVTLPAVGTPTEPGYQPASEIELSSEVVLRNAHLKGF